MIVTCVVFKGELKQQHSFTVGSCASKRPVGLDSAVLTGILVQVKRRWDEDVVFRNQTRGEPKQQKRFINDTIRSDFHRRFLHRYVR